MILWELLYSALPFLAIRMTSCWFSPVNKLYKGYKEAEKNGFDCFMFHDVDLILGQSFRIWVPKQSFG